LDGITSKDDEVMVVLTTNFLDRVDPALLRPGRMDTSIEMPTPDTATVSRMFRTFAPDLVVDEGPLSQFAEKLQGQIPAVIAEVVERARLIAMDHGSDTIRGHHLGESIDSMLDHMERLNRKPVKQQSLEHQVGAKIKDLWKEAYREA
jgi:ATP-dependent 26S proteasome regulatory subunit